MSIERCQLFGDYVFLDTDERRRFASAEHEYLIDQLQISPPQSVAAGRTSAISSLTFNHACKEFVWVIQQARMREELHEWFNYSNTTYEGEPNVIRTDLLESAILRLDGLDRFYRRNAQYFRVTQPYQYHTNVPNNYIYVYSFSLRPEDDQPAGSINCSLFSEIALDLKFAGNSCDGTNLSNEERIVSVYATNYNVFRIKGGLGGLAFIA